MVRIEVAYGTAEKQFLQSLDVPAGCTAREAVLLSELSKVFPEADLSAPLGIFGKVVKEDRVLREHDRVEVYRPLLIDPKEARRLRVARLADKVKESDGN